MERRLDSNNPCRHGVMKDEWIGYCDYLITYWGCEKCHKERKKEELVNGLKFLGLMFGMSFAIMGMIFFWLSPLKYGLQWWNVIGAIICTGICMMPMYRDYKDTGKLDLRLRFMR